MKEIPNTRIIVSVNHCRHASANLEVFEVSLKGQARKIYSFEEVAGSNKATPSSILYSLSPLPGTGYGDPTYNSRRSILGAIPVAGQISCHLYTFAISKSDDIVKLIRKSRWHSQYSTEDGI